MSDEEKSIILSYAAATNKLARYPGVGSGEAMNYLSLRLIAEVGEVARLISAGAPSASKTSREQMIRSLGGVCWCLAQIAECRGIDFGEMCLEAMDLFSEKEWIRSAREHVVCLSLSVASGLHCWLRNESLRRGEAMTGCVDNLIHLADYMDISLAEVMSANVGSLPVRKSSGLIEHLNQLGEADERVSIETVWDGGLVVEGDS